MLEGAADRQELLPGLTPRQREGGYSVTATHAATAKP